MSVQQQQPERVAPYTVISLPIGLKSGTISADGRKITDAVWNVPNSEVSVGMVWPAVEKPAVKSAA